MMDAIAVVSAIGAAVTAGATIMLWRVTSVLARETKRLSEATSQPQVVVTIESNRWSFIHADLVIANTGNATAFDVKISFEPALPLNHEGTGGPHEAPFQAISALRPSQQLSSWVGRMHDLIELRFTVSISWRKSPTAEVESYTYVLNMADYQNMRRLGSGDPLVQIADQIKKVQEDFHKFSTGWNKLKVDLYTSDDRDAQRDRYFGEEVDESQATPERSGRVRRFLRWMGWKQ